MIRQLAVVLEVIRERLFEREREGAREMPEMFMIAVMQFDMWNTKCINRVHCSPVTMHLSTLLTPTVCVCVCVCERERESMC